MGLGMSHLTEHSFWRDFYHWVCPVYTCGWQTTTHSILHCSNHHCAKQTLFPTMHQISGKISEQSGSMTTKFVLYDDSKLDFKPNRFYWCLQLNAFCLQRDSVAPWLSKMQSFCSEPVIAKSNYCMVTYPILWCEVIITFF